jgi:peptide/nickel transport system substrate-binding protein
MNGSSRSLALILIALAAVACGGAPEGDGRGGTVVIGSFTDVDSWNEYRSQQSFAVSLLHRIFLRLANEPGSLDAGPEDYVPSLAESWTAAEDGLSLTFLLRNARWSDGTPVTAADVRFTWEAQTSPDVAWVGAGNKERITDVEVIDDRTVVFHFDGKYPYQLADAVDGGILPSHLFGRVPFDQWGSHDWSAYSIGSGPFVLSSHRPGVESVLERNPEYFVPDLPLSDRVVVRYVPDAGNLLTQLLAGEIDFLDGVPPRDAHRLASNPDLTLIAYEYPGYDYLGWNGTRPPFDDPELRRAMTLAVDRQALVEDLLFGYGRISNGPLPSSSWGASPDIEPWPYDPEEAKRILVRKGFTGSRELAIELMTNSGSRVREEMLVKIQEQLSRIGVRATLQPLEMRTMRQKIVSGDYDGYLGGWVFAGRVELAVFFRSEGAYNVVGYHSPEVNTRFAELDAAASWEEMLPLLQWLQQRIHDDLPYTFLYEKERIAAHGSRLDGVTIDVPSDPLAGLERFRKR